MQYRSHTTRPNRARSARLGWAALVPLILAGCQSNSDRDLIARDRRMQEDQIYAMEDYISQYQQLVCRYRSENATLRRQLSDERVAAPAEREPQPMPRTPTTRPHGKNGGPSIEIPPTPKAEGPDVPPLSRRTSSEVREQQRNVQAAAYEETEYPVEAGSAAGKRDVQQSPGDRTPINPSPESSHDILLSGEVIENDEGGGPRLVIDVEPFDGSGQIAQFDGNVSLMLLAAGGDGSQRKLARWDFAPQDVRAAVGSTAGEPTMRFHVELPADTEVGDSTELWVRLVPAAGGKMLNHAKVDLSRPGVFSSRTDKLWPSEEAVVAASHVETSSKPAATDVSTAVNEGEWAIAAPGKPANLSPEPEQPGGGWKATSEVIPAAATMPVAPKRIDRPVVPKSTPTKAAAAEVAKKSAWSAERPGRSSNDARPRWSASR